MNALAVDTPATDAPVVQFRHVAKSFPRYHHLQGGLKGFLFNLPRAVKQLRADRFVALRDVDFSVGRGEAVGVIGRNGAGKSTLLALAAGVIRASAGDVIVRERPFPLLELGAGFHPECTATENVILNGMLLGAPRRALRARVEEIIDFAGLAEFADQPVRTFSSGMLARLGFAVVAHLDPKLLLIDEILAVGDYQFQAKCLSVMKEFKARGCTILFVSHSLADVERMCDRVAWIEQGCVRRFGPTREVIEAYEKASSG
jgi:lipopolysaccharide transport system ATP-binding protein